MKKNTIKLIAFTGVMFLVQNVVQAQTMPSFKTTQEKEAWIKAHPEEYKKILENTTKATPATSTTSSSTMGTTQAQPTGKTVDAKDFPVYVNTGDKQKDDANYAKAKQEWIATHPEEYKKMTEGKAEKK